MSEANRTLDRVRHSKFLSYHFFLPGFLLAFTFCIFAPIDLFFTASNELWFSLGDLLPGILFFAFCVFVLVTVLAAVLPPKASVVFRAVVYAVSFLLYLQGNVLVIDFGTLNGAEINWGQYTVPMILDAMLWMVVIGLFIFLFFRFRKKFRRIVEIVSVILLVTQIVSLGVFLVRMDTKTEDAFLSTEKLYTVSKTDNTIVFILDAFDSGLMQTLVETNREEIDSSFAGFVYYHNTVGGATRTRYAIPYILTGKTNDTGDTYAEYIRQSYKESPLFAVLGSGEYNTGFYTEAPYVDREQEKAIDNLSTGQKLKPTSRLGLAGTMMKMTAFKYMPFALKPAFWMYTKDFEQWKAVEGGKKKAYKLNDIQFYENLLDNHLSKKGSLPGFRFIHLNGAHGPYVMDENMQAVAHEVGSAEKQGLGALRIVSKYLDDLKELGIYDNSTVFVMADHGDRDYEQNPLFMVKRKNADQGFRISEEPISYCDVPAMLSDALQGELDIEGNYIADEGRYFYVGHEHDNTYDIVEYVTDGAAYDASAMRETGKHYAYVKADYTYRLGTEVSFAERDGATAQKYMVSGFSAPYPTFAWTNGNEAELRFDGLPAGRNLMLTLNYAGVMNDSQQCFAYAGERLIGSFIAGKQDEKKLVIPKEAVIDGKLVLTLKLPDAYSPAEHGTGTDPVKRGIRFTTLCLKETDEAFDAERQTETEP